MLKKFLSILLAVMMVVSVMTVAVVTTSAAELESTKLYFDTGTAEKWQVGKNKKIQFYIFSLETGEVLPFGGKKTNGTQVTGSDTLWSFDPAKQGITLNPDENYAIKFVNTTNGMEAYSLLFDESCLGHVAHIAEVEYENPVDSSKWDVVSFWDDSIDPAAYGPQLQISSTGKVIGTCIPKGQTPQSIFEKFLTDPGAQGLANAREYSGFDDQTLFDGGSGQLDGHNNPILGTAEGLGLTKDDVKAAIENAGIETTWDYDKSTLPGGSVHEHTPGEPVREKEVPATCTAEGSYDEVVYCTECGEEISRETKTIEKIAHTPGDTIQEKLVPATCTEEGSFEAVVYCEVCHEELSRETLPIPKEAHTPGDTIQENLIPATCTEEGSYEAVVYCEVCHEELSRETLSIPAEGHKINFVEEVPATYEAAGVKAHYVCDVCEKLFADETGTIEVTAEDLVIPQLIPHTHVAGDPVRENEVPATCEEDGSYDEVIYCVECGEFMSKETKAIPALGHDLKEVAEVPAEGVKNGVAAHFECTRCGKLFVADGDGYKEVTAEELVIPAQHMRGDANMDGEVDIVDATWIQRYMLEVVAADKIDLTAADVDLDGEVTIIDATLIQRYVLGICDWDKKPVA